MPTRNANSKWNGGLADGNGQLTLGSNAWSGPYDWRSRSDDGATTNPEELIAAAHAGCFNMALSHALGQAGYAPTNLDTTAHVTLAAVDGGFSITSIKLVLRGSVPGISAAEFLEIANGAKQGCPVSKALSSTPITLEAELLEGVTV